ncbi:hypothetical protein PCE1_000594 [Barthelona sp. PCE]
MSGKKRQLTLFDCGIAGKKEKKKPKSKTSSKIIDSKNASLNRRRKASQSANNPRKKVQKTLRMEKKVVLSDDEDGDVCSMILVSKSAPNISKEQRRHARKKAALPGVRNLLDDMKRDSGRERRKAKSNNKLEPMTACFVPSFKQFESFAIPSLIIKNDLSSQWSMQGIVCPRKTRVSLPCVNFTEGIECENHELLENCTSPDDIDSLSSSQRTAYNSMVKWIRTLWNEDQLNYSEDDIAFSPDDYSLRSFLLLGSASSGKSTLVRLFCDQLKLNAIKLGFDQPRSSAALKNILFDSNSGSIRTHRANKNVFIVEDIDLHCEKDKGFYQVLRKLCSSSIRPVILTARNTPIDLKLNVEMVKISSVGRKQFFNRIISNVVELNDMAKRMLGHLFKLNIASFMINVHFWMFYRSKQALIGSQAVDRNQAFDIIGRFTRYSSILNANQMADLLTDNAAFFSFDSAVEIDLMMSAAPKLSEEDMDIHDRDVILPTECGRSCATIAASEFHTRRSGMQKIEEYNVAFSSFAAHPNTFHENFRFAAFSTNRQEQFEKMGCCRTMMYSDRHKLRDTSSRRHKRSYLDFHDSILDQFSLSGQRLNTSLENFVENLEPGQVFSPVTVFSPRNIVPDEQDDEI